MRRFYDGITVNGKVGFTKIVGHQDDDIGLSESGVTHRFIQESLFAADRIFVLRNQEAVAVQWPERPQSQGCNE